MQKINQFEIMKKGAGYNPVQVDEHISTLESQIISLKSQLGRALENTDTTVHLHDPEGAVMRVLAAAQEASDKMIAEAEDAAKERVAAYHREQRAEIEAQRDAYEKKKVELSAYTAKIRELQKELERESRELVEHSKLKMNVIAQATEDLNSLFSVSEALNNIEADTEINAPASPESSESILASSEEFVTQKIPETPAPAQTANGHDTTSEPAIDPLVAPPLQMDTVQVNAVPKQKEARQKEVAQNMNDGLSPEERRWAQEILETATQEFSTLAEELGSKK